MKLSKLRLPVLSILLAAALSSTVGVSAASADDPVDTEAQALTEFRAELVAANNTVDLAKFDALSTSQRSTLADFLLGESVDSTTVPTGAVWNNGIATYGEFEWGTPVGEGDAAARGYNISGWGTQWFAFAGISILQVKNIITVTKDWDNTYGSVITGVPGSSCLLQHNYDPFAQVSVVQQNAFTNGYYEGVSECKVTVSRGVPTPWGQISWSTREAIHVVRMDNTGWITANTWA